MSQNGVRVCSCGVPYWPSIAGPGGKDRDLCIECWLTRQAEQQAAEPDGERPGNPAYVIDGLENSRGGRNHGRLYGNRLGEGFAMLNGETYEGAEPNGDGDGPTGETSDVDS